MNFSERIGIIKAKDKMQLNSMDDDLRNCLWNAVDQFYFDKVENTYISRSRYNAFFNDLWNDFLKIPLDTMDDQKYNVRSQIRLWFLNWPWYKVYDFIEYISNSKCPTDGIAFKEYCNKLFERELSGYRFINELITPITNTLEIEEIDSAITNSAHHNLVGVQTHIESALRKLSDRESPDYRNSIKESISAVESIAKVISGNPKDSLGGALDKIKGRIKLHPSLERGFKQIYGYTSDTDGIRHSLAEESTCDLEDAKYMLVASSAFVNYLIVKSNKAGITI